MANLKPMDAVGLAEIIVDPDNSNRRFCFILGAGASRESRIRTARELIPLWREEMMKGKTQASFRRRADDADIEWADCEKIFQEGYRPQSDDYFTVYALRYAERERAGYDFLKAEMKGKRPSIGYYCLANILRSTRHKLVITTNFDSMTEDALFDAAGEHPLVLGHESLAAFLGGSIDEPVVAKIHRDLFYRPMNRPKEMENLAQNWRGPLQRALAQCIPIVVGYAGGDKTLMSLLKERELPCEKIYWCTLANEELSPEAREVLEYHNGRWVKIDGFDDLMYLLASKMQLVPAYGELEEGFHEKLAEYKKALAKMEEKHRSPVTPGQTAPASEQALELSEAVNEASAGDDDTLKQYNAIISQAWRYYNGKQYDEAFAECGRAIALLPTRAHCYNVRGVMLHNLGRYEQAVDSYSQAAELEPDNALHLIYRSISYDFLKKYPEAKADITCAIALEPENPSHYNRRAVILFRMKEYPAALEDSQKALSLAPDNTEYLLMCSKIQLCANQREEALVTIQGALNLEPENGELHYMKGIIHNWLGDKPAALKEAELALSLKPEEQNYQTFRDNLRKEIEAEQNKSAPE